jgi:hypothetical protein
MNTRRVLVSAAVTLVLAVLTMVLLVIAWELASAYIP